MGETLTTHTASLVGSFVNSIGINGAADAATAVQLAYLGIDNFRTNTDSAADLLAAGAGGANIDVIFPYYLYPDTVTPNDVSAFLSQIDQAASVVNTVEGPDEVNVDPDSFNGLSGPAAMEAIQKALYTTAAADPVLNNATHTTSVYDFSVLMGTAPGTYSGMSAYADFNNVHAYGSDGAPPSWFLPDTVWQNTIAGNKPVVVTETGYQTMPGSGVDQPTQARFDIATLLDDYQLGVTTTYLYDLQDYASGSEVSDFSAYFGLYTTDGTIKLAGTALHNLTTLLSQGASGTLPAGTSLNYALNGLVYYTNSELFAKAGGVCDLAVWNETTEWNPGTDQEVAVPANNVTLTLAQTFGSISVYDPLLSSSPIETVNNASSITVALSNDPLIIEMTPALLATPVSNTVATTDEAAASPFSKVVISDPAAGNRETAAVTLSEAANGTLSDPNAASDGGVFNNGTYSVSGSAAAVASALDGLLFTPTAHQVAPGQTVTTSFSAAIIDTAGAQCTISSTLTATAVGDPITATENAEITLLYQQVLDRAPDPSGLSNYVGQRANGVPLQTIQTGMAFSPEAGQDITNLYQQVLGRAPDPGGFLSKQTELSGGESLTSVRSEMAFSQEEQADLKRAFTTAYGPAATPSQNAITAFQAALTQSTGPGATGASQSSILAEISSEALGTTSSASFVYLSAGTHSYTSTGTGDTFAVSSAAAALATTLADFNPAADTLQFSSSLFSSLSAVLAATVDINGSAILSLPNGHGTITLAGVSPASLTQQDISFG